jgi:hypothetical protein
VFYKDAPVVQIAVVYRIQAKADLNEWRKRPHVSTERGKETVDSTVDSARPDAIEVGLATKMAVWES